MGSEEVEGQMSTEYALTRDAEVARYIDLIRKGED